ncbi:MAG: DUF6020 family protein [Defluviitaleaceae bacterium]|nr:DUF6020 family protein [Defluviitaleaceae bacterium]
MRRLIISAIFAFLSWFAFFSNPGSFFVPVNHFGGAVFLVAVFLLYYKQNFFPVRKPELVFTALLSMFWFIGVTFTLYDSFKLLTASPINAVYSAIILAGYLPFFYAATCFLTEKILAYKPESKIKSEEGRRFNNFLTPFLFFLLAWLPYFFIYFPGTFINDSVRQLSQFEGVDPFTNHHPIISTFFMGALFRAGDFFGGVNAGLATITIVHNLMMAAAFSLALCYLKKWGIAYNVRMVIMVFFAVFPVFGIWAQTILKDTHSAAVVLVFVLLYIDVIRDYSRKRLVLCITAAIIASLLRNEIVYVVTPAILALAILPASRKRRIVMLAAGVAVFFAVRVIVGGAMAITDAEAGSVREALSVPFQQTARFMRYHEITDEERAVIAATFHDYYLLGEVYHPRISDPVKNRFIEGADLGAYFRTWAAMGLRAPLTYFEAAVAVSFSYVVPFGPDWHIVWVDSSHDAIPDFDRGEIYYMFSTPAMRFAPARLLEFAERVPVLGFFFHTGNYTWGMAFLVLLLIKSRARQVRGEHRGHMSEATHSLEAGNFALLYFLPALMIILACMASPVHGFWRYYLPIMFMFPVLAAVTLGKCPHEKSLEASSER